MPQRQPVGQVPAAAGVLEARDHELVVEVRALTVRVEDRSVITFGKEVCTEVGVALVRREDGHQLPVEIARSEAKLVRHNDAVVLPRPRDHALSRDLVKQLLDGVALAVEGGEGDVGVRCDGGLEDCLDLEPLFVAHSRVFIRKQVSLASTQVEPSTFDETRREDASIGIDNDLCRVILKFAEQVLGPNLQANRPGGLARKHQG
mmetsp:Transcript_3933/g.9184  ORF Transcript_3933/g.9184 Transcript_3933/m.9184 type:complete len:204 (+) Transcript_3933:395-1006(+)